MCHTAANVNKKNRKIKIVMSDPFCQQVLGYDSVNAATLETVNRLQKGFSLLEAEAKNNRQTLQDSNTFNEKIQVGLSILETLSPFWQQIIALKSHRRVLIKKQCLGIRYNIHCFEKISRQWYRNIPLDKRFKKK